MKRKVAPIVLPILQSLAGLIRDTAPGGFWTADRPATDLARRRAAKVITEAWIRLPHASITSKANLTPDRPQNPMERIVHRAVPLQEEVYSRLKGGYFDADPLEQEVDRQRGVDPSVFTRITMGTWTGEDTPNGDLCIGAFMEAMSNGREDAGNGGTRREPNPQGPRKSRGTLRSLSRQPLRRERPR